MEAPWRIELLGGLRVIQRDRIITRFRTQKTGALLAYLACNLHRSHPRGELIELHWPECDLEAGRNSLRVALASLRRQLEPPVVPNGAVLASNRASVQLNPAACVTDVALFEAAVQAAARAGSDDERTSWLTDAGTLYGGELLPGYFEGWILQERQRLAEAFLRALGQLAALREAGGDLQGAIECAWRAAAADPLREEGHRDLMRLLAAAGQSDAALRHYREVERLITEQLGVPPEIATRVLARQIAKLVARETGRQDEETGRPRDGAKPNDASPHPAVALPPSVPTDRRPSRACPPPSSSRADGNLPIQFDRFFGREPEIVRLREILQDGAERGDAKSDGVAAPSTHQLASWRERSRLVTLTGPGGSGKTRLALAVARRLAESSQAAVWFVPLAELTNGRRIVDAVRDALRLPRSGGADPLEQVVAALADRAAILLLDNFEHLAAEGAPLLKRLLEQAATLTCLVTSRQRLDLAGEREFPVPPLPTPTGDETPEELSRCESVQLFVDRAQAVRPDFQVTPANRAAVAALCRRLEGIPLALELAAGRARALTPSQMLAHLERRFDFLVSRQRYAAARHRTLRAAVEWSYRLLSPEAQRFYAGLSVFRGGWTQAAAEAVCKEPLAVEYLERLQECSLLTAEEGPEEMRFQTLETLREYAREQLGPEERGPLARRHLAYYLALAEQADAKFDEGPGQATWLHRLEREQDNLRAALEWSEANGEVEEALRLAGAMSAFWVSRGYLTEGRERLAGLLASVAASGRTSARAKALCVAGMLAFYQDDYPMARSPLEESAAIWRELGDRRGTATSLGLLGQVAASRADYAAAQSLYNESLTLRREVGNPQLIAHSLVRLGEVALCQGDYGAAHSRLEESLAIFRQFGDKHSIAYSLNNLGEVGRYQGDYGAARSHVEEGLAILRELGDRHCIARSLYILGELARCQGKHGVARSLYGESLAIRRELGTRWEIVECLEGLAAVAGAVGQPEGAARLFGAAMALRGAIAAPLPPNRQPEGDAQLAALRVTLGETTFAAAWTAGRMLTWEQAVIAALGVAAAR